MYKVHTNYSDTDSRYTLEPTAGETLQGEINSSAGLLLNDLGEKTSRPISLTSL